jgi:hypothetical protein
MADYALDADSEKTGAAARDTFVIRVWSGDDSGAVRGHIVHVRSRQRAYFATRQRLQSFIEEHIQEPGS